MKALSSIAYKILVFFVTRIYLKAKVEYTENMPSTPSIYVGNHSKANGPLMAEFYFPGKHYIWCAGEMMKLSEVPAYAYKDFWHGKPSYIKWVYKIASYLIAPLCVCLFNNAHTIPVYHDNRIITTFRKTIERLEDGADIVIFPEHDKPYNHILCELQDGFVDVAKLYYKRHGVCLDFVPLYIAPRLKSMYIGTPIRFNPDAELKDERARICRHISEEITRIAESLPPHTVVPYNNISKKQYPSSRQASESDKEIV